MRFAFCHTCRTPRCERLCAWLKARRKLLVRLAWILLVFAFFFALGKVAVPVNGPGFCRVCY